MTLFSRLKPTKKILMILAGFFCLFFVASLFSVAQVNGFNQRIVSLSHWISLHKDTWIVWHVVIGFSIFFVWGRKIDREGKRLKKTVAEIERAKLFRYCVIIGMLLIDGILHLWR